MVETAEKKVISNLSSVGLYYFTKGTDFVKYSTKMIEENIRTNNEFYVCPLYNLLIKRMAEQNINQYVYKKYRINLESDSMDMSLTSDERDYNQEVIFLRF